MQIPNVFMDKFYYIWFICFYELEKKNCYTVLSLEFHWLVWSALLKGNAEQGYVGKVFYCIELLSTFISSYCLQLLDGTVVKYENQY